MQTNPGEYYLQNNLKHFFGYSYTNTQIRTLMSMIKNYPIEHARAMTQEDYDWWENDPIWKKRAAVNDFKLEQNKRNKKKKKTR